MKKSICFYCVVIVLAAACSSSTEITGSWKNPKAGGENIRSILVTSLSAKTNARETLETDLTHALQSKGYQALKSIDVMPPTFTDGKEPDREALLDKVKGSGVNAILTVALINKETENRYVPGSYNYEPIPRFAYYGRFWGYYNAWYPTLYSPGYYTEDKVYFIETNLYDAKTEDLLWSAQSETYNPGNLASFSKDFSSIVLAKMEKDGVIRK